MASVGDEISRWPLLSGDRDLGLRGGTIRFTAGASLRITLRDVRWVTDAPIDGVATWNPSSGWVTARLTVHPRAGRVVQLTAQVAAVRDAEPAGGHPRPPGHQDAGRDLPGAVRGGRRRKGPGPAP